MASAFPTAVCEASYYSERQIKPATDRLWPRWVAPARKALPNAHLHRAE